MEIKDKTALITGGSKGIGFAIANRLLSVGVRVMICGREKAVLDDASEKLDGGDHLKTAVCDIRSESEVEQLIGKCVTKFGGIDILINNAGVGFLGKTCEEMPPEEFRTTLETNLYGVYYACHFAIPYLKAGGSGFIINISSLAGQNAHPKMSAYNASKFALNGFTEALMQELRHDKIKVSYICPGSVNTEFNNGTISDEKAWQLQPCDIADAVLYVLTTPTNALPSKIEIRPAAPPTR
ncbi:MAG: SDR family oxidoreductase [Pyrinomonadaceae bacterium]